MIGSAKLNTWKSAGDSLMGRYFAYRIHPLSVAELTHPTRTKKKLISLPHHIKEDELSTLLKYGGFPDPYIQHTPAFYQQWKKLHWQQMFQEDLRDLSQIQEISQLEILAKVLQQQAGELLSYTSLSKKLNVSINTIKRWLSALEALYCICPTKDAPLNFRQFETVNM